MSFSPSPHVAAGLAAASQAQRDPLRPEKVAIMGTAPSSRLLAHSLTRAIRSGAPRRQHGRSGLEPSGTAAAAGRMFEIHTNLLWPEYISYGGPYVKWLNEKNFPLMAIDQTLFPRARCFPGASL